MEISPQERDPDGPRAFSLEEALTALIVDGGLLGAPWPATSVLVEASAAVGGRAPDTLLLDGRQLLTLRERLRQEADEDAQSLVLGLRALGEAAAAEAFSPVTDKAVPGPTGNSHDYVSLARYWWPDPDTVDGLPYIRRDGEVNPESQSDDTDSSRLARFSDGVLALAVCGYLLDEQHLSELARERLLGWLVDPETRQSPHFSGAQLVRGRSGVRAPAIIDARRMLAPAEAFRLLRSEGLVSAADEQEVLAWFGELLQWLVASPEGAAASRGRNNVAVWCALERAVLADLVRNDDLLSASLAWAGDLLAEQVEADGALPAELTRQNPADYLAFAFVALSLLARVGEERGRPLWDRADGDGRGLAATRDWLAALASSSTHHDAAPTPTTVALAMRLLAWREDTYLRAVQRSAQLADDLGQRDGQVARLTARNAHLRAELDALRAKGHVGRLRDLRGSGDSPMLAKLQHQARDWPVVGPMGRQAKTTLHHLRNRADGARPPHAAHGPTAEREQQLIREFEASGLADRPVTFVLYRILGNDLPPRHASGQTLENVRFILEHEPALADCEKRWIINRIVDPDAEEALLRLLEAHGQPVLRLPFDPDEYARQPFDLQGLPRPDYLTTPAWDTSRPDLRARAVSSAYRLKNLYAMNNNAARNAAIEEGRNRATWILPFDGSIFVTEAAWADLRGAALARPHLPYLVVPMARIIDNDALLNAGSLPPANEEPQVAFRCDAREHFDESRPYGRRPKVDLLWRLGVPGPWENWLLDPWDPPFPKPGPDHGCFQTAGLAVRLAAGDPSTKSAGSQGLKERGSIRETSIVGFLRSLDGAHARRAWVGQDLAFYDDGLLELVAGGEMSAGRATILAAAETALLRGPFAVTDKTTLPPSGNPHDYWHPAPYWWPDPSRPDGIPYQRRDGRRLPGTDLFSTGSEQFDRTRLQLMLDDVTALAIGWRVTGDERFARHGARQVRTWFVDESTAMTPHLASAQVRRGHEGDRGMGSGIIELKDLYYFLDGVRLLRRSGQLTASDCDSFNQWLNRYLEWLLTSTQGHKERLALNNHGTCYDLQVMAIARFLDEGEEFSAAALRATGRLHAHFDATGSQPRELARTETRHYCAFTLQSWANLARVAESGGCDLWREPGGQLSPLARGLDWYLEMQDGDGWPYPQEQPFDARRDAPLEAVVGLLRQPSSSAADVATTTTTPWVLHPDDGIAPFWPMGLGPRSHGPRRRGECAR